MKLHRISVVLSAVVIGVWTLTFSRGCKNHKAAEEITSHPKIGYLYYDGWSSKSHDSEDNNPFATETDKANHGSVTITMPIEVKDGWVVFNQWDIGVLDGREEIRSIYLNRSTRVKSFNMVYKPVEQ